MVIERRAARAILLTPQHEILLMRVRPPRYQRGFWITPGGGLEVGENLEGGLRRELAEELGLSDFELGPLIWRREHSFYWDAQRVRQREEYVVVHVECFEPVMTDPNEARVLERFQWWSLPELALLEEPLAPARLVDIVRGYLSSGGPASSDALEFVVD